jgi:GNAT superfamily N-acetyltransferase
VDREELLARNLASLRVFVRAVGSSADGSRVLELDGVVASLTPSVPNRSIVNSVVSDGAAALEQALDELTKVYRDAGVRAWTVWVAPGDRRTARVLERAGHRLDANPAAMALDLSAWEGANAGEGGLELAGRPALADVARINDSAYDFGGDFVRALRRLPAHAHLYVALVDGCPASCVVTMDEGGDCGVFFVATLPEARGRGLATALMRRALREGLERGCATSTLQATKAGQPIYERLRYEDLGALEMWERREA